MDRKLDSYITPCWSRRDKNGRSMWQFILVSPPQSKSSNKVPKACLKYLAPLLKHEKIVNFLLSIQLPNFYIKGLETKSVVSIICVYVVYKCVCSNCTKFQQHTMAFQLYNLKFVTHTIVCSGKLLSFGINYFLLSFSDYLEHSWNHLNIIIP